MRRLPSLLVTGLFALAACTGTITDPGSNPGDPDGGTLGNSDGGTVIPPPPPIPPGNPVYGTDHPRIYIAANKDRLNTALANGDAPAVRFKQLVDGELAGANYYAFAPSNAALMGALTGNASYCTWAVQQSDQFVASEEATIASGGAPAVAADSYLQVGPTIGGLMLTYDWCFDSVSNAQRGRWLAYAAQAVWNVWNHNQAVWGGVSHPWSGWATDDPSDNYYYSFLRATMLFGLAAHDEHPDAAGWLTFFRTTKFQGELLPKFNADLQGGGSREGTGYGTSMMNLWSLYDLWQASTGEDLARQTQHTRASLLDELHAIVPARDFIAPTGDQARDASASLFDYHRDYIEKLVFLFRDDPLAAYAKWAIDHSSVPQMSQQFMAIDDFLYETPTVAETPIDPVDTSYYASGTGQVYAASGWDNDATWVNLIAGPYTESHAHRDQGHLMLFKGDWLADDANARSHSGINQDEEDHNLVRITSGGSTVTQALNTTSTLTALHQGTGWTHMAADLTPAYGGKSQVSNVEREVVFIKPDTVVVFDRVTSASGTQQVWQLNSPGSPTIAGARATFPTASHTLVVDRVVPDTAATTVKTWSQNSEYTGGYRLDETLDGGAQQYLHVLSIDSAVTSVARSDAGGRTGVVITLADGRTATVRFSPTGVDGTLAITAGANVGSVSVSLAPGVDPLPE